MVGYAVEDGVGVQILILAVAAPERRRDRDWRRAVADGRIAGRAVERVGLVAEPEVAAAAIAAVAARQIFFQRDAVAFLDAEAGRGPEPGHMSDRLVPEDQRTTRPRIFQIIGPVAAAHAAELDAQQPAVGRQVRLLERAYLGAPDVVGHRCGDLVHGRTFPGVTC